MRLRLSPPAAAITKLSCLEHNNAMSAPMASKSSTVHEHDKLVKLSLLTGYQSGGSKYLSLWLTKWLTLEAALSGHLNVSFIVPHIVLYRVLEYCTTRGGP